MQSRWNWKVSESRLIEEEQQILVWILTELSLGGLSYLTWHSYDILQPNACFFLLWNKQHVHCNYRISSVHIYVKRLFIKVYFLHLWARQEKRARFYKMFTCKFRYCKHYYCCIISLPLKEMIYFYYNDFMSEPFVSLRV